MCPNYLDKISRRAGKAIVEHDMIRAGDRVLVAVSGGKDSLTLLHVMLHRKAVAPVDFDLMAIHVDMGLPGPDLVALEEHFRSLGVAYYIERTDMFRTPDGKAPQDLNCFWCSWNRRKVLFQFAQKHGFNRIALGHHLDDVVETILLNQFFKGELSSICPRQEMFKGALTLIRPLAYENEAMIRRFAQEAGLDKFETCRCPVAPDTRRAAIKAFIAEMAKSTPAVRQNIFNSLNNIKPEYIPDAANLCPPASDL